MIKIPQFKVMSPFNIALMVLALIQFYLAGTLKFWVEKPVPTLIDAIDFSTKLIPGFIIPYYSIYLMLILIVVLIIRSGEVSRMTVFLFSLLVLWSLVNLGQALFPTQTMNRPVIKEQGLFFDLVKDLYNSEKAFNTMPNWHVATAVLCMIAWFKLGFGRRWFFLVWGLLVALSPIFLKNTHIIDVAVAVPLAFLSYSFSQKVAGSKIRTETVQEVVKTFTLESLLQSVAIGIRDEHTLVSLIESLTRIDKSLSDEDRREIEQFGAKLDPPAGSLKDTINKLINSIDVEMHLSKAREMFGSDSKNYSPTDKELKAAIEQLVTTACLPFDNAGFRDLIIRIRKKNTQVMNASALEESATERSKDIIYKFKSFIESHKTDIPAIKTLSSDDSRKRIGFEDISNITKELRKPPYEISADEIWNAYHRVDNARVKPLGENPSPANIISLTKFALGHSEILEPFADSVERKFRHWLTENESAGRTYSEEELEWLRMMKSYLASNLMIEMISFNNPPFASKGGASKAYNLFGPDLNRIIYEFNEKLI